MSEAEAGTAPGGGDGHPDGAVPAADVLLMARRFRVVRRTEPGPAGAGRVREVIEHPGSVVVVPLLSPVDVCLVEVVRVAVGRTLLELPAGTLDRVERVVKTLGMVNSAPDFDQQPRVIDGYADLFVEVFGEDRGRGARSAVGMAALPMQIAVEVETILKVRP